MKKEDQLLGIHHVTAMTSDAEKNYYFFTDVLETRLVRKTVNQGDIYAYHTYFVNDLGTSSATMILFDFPSNLKGLKGTNTISRTGSRIPLDAALTYYENRLSRFAVKHTGISEGFGKKVLRFWDFDDQAYQLISDGLNQGVAAGTLWKKGPIPTEFTIYDLGLVEIAISYPHEFKGVFEEVLGSHVVAQEGNHYLLEIGQGGNGA